MMQSLLVPQVFSIMCTICTSNKICSMYGYTWHVDMCACAIIILIVMLSHCSLDVMLLTRSSLNEYNYMHIFTRNHMPAVHRIRRPPQVLCTPRHVRTNVRGGNWGNLRGGAQIDSSKKLISSPTAWQLFLTNRAWHTLAVRLRQQCRLYRLIKTHTHTHTNYGNVAMMYGMWAYEK